MKQYRIVNQVSGVDLGTYEAFDPLDAQERMYAAAGYPTGTSFDNIPGDPTQLRVDEVK